MSAADRLGFDTNIVRLLRVTCGCMKMRIGSWDIYVGFLHYRLPEEWEDLEEAFKRARPSWDVVGIHMWHEVTDEGHMLEVRFQREHTRVRLSAHYSHLTAYWFVEACNCRDCKALKRRLRSSKQ
jgi:nitrate reductase alpha subunit